MQLLTNTVVVSCTIDGIDFINYATSNFILKRRNVIMCHNQNCCVQKVLTSSVAPPTTSGATYILNTSFAFANAVDGDRFLIKLPTTIPAQTILGNVILVGSGAPTSIALEAPCFPENLVSDQLTGLSAICCVYAKTSARMRVIKAFNTCGCECSIRKSAGTATINVKVLSDVKAV